MKRSTGGILLLGAAARAELATHFGPDALGCAPAKKRAEEAEKWIEDIRFFAHSGAHEKCAHLARQLLSRSAAHCLDYDAKHLRGHQLAQFAESLADRIA